MRHGLVAGSVIAAAGLICVVGTAGASVGEIFPSPYIHIGGDEPWGMPHGLWS